MTTIEEAWAAIEQLLATTTYSGHALQTEQQDAESAKDAKPTINKPHLRDAVRAGFLTVHVAACCERATHAPKATPCGGGMGLGFTWYCDTAKQIQEQLK